MSIKTLDDVIQLIDREEFDYAFCEYSDFMDIDDEIFKILKSRYVRASKDLKEYLSQKTGVELD